MKTAIRGAQNHEVSALAETIGIVAGAIALAAFGVAGLVTSSTEGACDEMDTTERLLSGGNRARTLAALERYNRGQFVSHDIHEIAA